MLTNEQKRLNDFYRYPNGMLNVAWIAGFIRGVKPGARMFYIQQTNNSNLMLPIYLRKGDQIPPRFKEMSPVRVICHIEGGQVDAEHLQGKQDESGKIEYPVERIAKAVVIGFDAANVLDMPPAIAFQKVPPQGAPEDSVDFKPFTREESMSDSSNIVRIAGFVQSVIMQTPDSKSDNSDCCVLLIRQTEKEAGCIPVRYYSKRLAEAVYNRIKRGLPIAIDAAYRVRAKPIGEPDPESGLAPVVRYPYLHSMQPPAICTKREIIHTPEWAQVMLDDYFAKTNRRKERKVESEGEVVAPVAPISVEGLE